RHSWSLVTGRHTKTSTAGAQYYKAPLQNRRPQDSCVTLHMPPVGKSLSHYGTSSSACGELRPCCPCWRPFSASSVSVMRLKRSYGRACDRFLFASSINV